MTLSGTEMSYPNDQMISNLIPNIATVIPQVFGILGENSLGKYNQYLKDHLVAKVIPLSKRTASFYLELNVLGRLINDKLIQLEVPFVLHSYNYCNKADSPLVYFELREGVVVCPYNKQIRIAEKYLSLLNSAKSRSLPFNLHMSDVKRLMEAKTCFYTKVPLTNSNRTADRVDATKGYVRGNVVACTSVANQIKNRAFEVQEVPIEMLRKILELRETGKIPSRATVTTVKKETK